MVEYFVVDESLRQRPVDLMWHGGFMNAVDSLILNGRCPDADANILVSIWKSGDTVNVSGKLVTNTFRDSYSFECGDAPIVELLLTLASALLAELLGGRFMTHKIPNNVVQGRLL